jgi:hypothetical protein
MIASIAATIAATVASFIGYTPYVYNETLGAPYYQNTMNGGRIIYNESHVAPHSNNEIPYGVAANKTWYRCTVCPANETYPDHYWKVEHFVDQHPAWVYNNIILFLWLLWAGRALYKRFRAPIDPIEPLFLWPVFPLFFLGAARIAACFALNLYYEGWLGHTQQVLYVEEVERMAYHCSYLVLIPLALLTAMPYVFDEGERRAAKKNK